MMNNNARVRNYYMYFMREGSGGHGQFGGTLPSFRGGTQYQSGSGFGDILRTMFRVISPIFFQTAGSFLSPMTQALSHGASFKEAAREGVRPAVQALASGTSDALQRLAAGVPQTGGGGKGRRCKKRKRKSNQVSKQQYKRRKIFESPIKYNF